MRNYHVTFSVYVDTKLVYTGETYIEEISERKAGNRLLEFDLERLTGLKGLNDRKKDVTIFLKRIMDGEKQKAFA